MSSYRWGLCRRILKPEPIQVSSPCVLACEGDTCERCVMLPGLPALTHLRAGNPWGCFTKVHGAWEMLEVSLMGPFSWSSNGSICHSDLVDQYTNLHPLRSRFALEQSCSLMESVVENDFTWLGWLGPTKLWLLHIWKENTLCKHMELGQFFFFLLLNENLNGKSKRLINPLKPPGLWITLLLMHAGPACGTVGVKELF